MNIKNRPGRAAGIAAAAVVIGGLGLTGVAWASTFRPAAVTSVAHQAGPATPAAPVAFNACVDRVDPNRFDPAGNTTLGPPIQVLGRTIRLRYNANRCAWGQIINGSPGDELWVDRSYDGGHHWDGRLGDTFVHYGQDNYTTAWNDGGWGTRVCAVLVAGAEVYCQPSWY